MAKTMNPYTPIVKIKKSKPQLTKKTGQRPGDYATGGRVGKSSGGVASRLSKSGPVGKPN